MRISFTKALLLICVCIFEQSTIASAVRISFLDNEDCINQATNYLSSKGCDNDTMIAFRRVIDWYNATPTDLNLKGFPQRKNGFYSFSSMTNLIEALHKPLIYTHHQTELNCFDATFLIACHFIQIDCAPDDISGPFLVPFTTTNGDVTLTLAATPRDAYTYICPSWWIEASKTIFPKACQNKRICLTAALDSFHILPRSTNTNNLPTTLLHTLQMAWSRQGISFPTNCELVVFHSVALNSYNVLSTHCGLLFHDKYGYIYFEKSGSSGPYVRLEFKRKADLSIWYKSAIKPVTDNGNILFATFNNTEITKLDERN